MNFKEIEELLDKFYEGSTTLTEEQQLRNFFTNESVPPHLSEHAELFRHLVNSGKEELPDPEFENRFLAEIEKTALIHVVIKRNQVLFLSSIAAGLLLLAGTIFTFRHDVFLRSTKNNVAPEIAYQQAKNALAMLSVNLNIGLDQALKLGDFQKGLKEVQKLQAFQKGIDQLNKFSKFYQYQQIIINPGDQPRP